MAEQKADTQQLHSLVQTLGELTTYCTGLQSSATTFAYSLPGDWSGPAATRFQGQFHTWVAGATAMVTFADGLHKQAEAAYKGYDSAIDAETTRWGSGSGTSVKLDAATFETDAEVFKDKADKIIDALSALYDGLSGTDAMAGDSDLGESFAHGENGYRNSAEALAEGANNAAMGFYNLYGNLVNTGRAYGAAQTAGTEQPKPPETFAPGSTQIYGSIPDAYGDGGTAFWDLGEFDNWIQDGLDKVGVHLPSGDVDKLRKAAGAWRTFANSLAGEPAFTASSNIPQNSKITELIDDANEMVSTLITNANALATYVEGTADGLQQAKDQIADIIKQMIIEIGIEVGAGIVVSVLTAGLAAGPAAAGIMARIGVFCLRILSKVKTLAKLIDHLRDIARVLQGMRKTKMLLNVLKDGTLAAMASSGSKLIMNNVDGLHSDSYKQQDVFGLDELGAFVGGAAGTGITDLAKGASPGALRKIAASGAGGMGGGALGEYAKAAVPGGKSVNGVHKDAAIAGVIGGVTNVAFSGLGEGLKAGLNNLKPTTLNPINTPTPGAGGPGGTGPGAGTGGGTPNLPDSPSANAGGAGGGTPGGSGGPGSTNYDGPTGSGSGDPGTGMPGDGGADVSTPDHVDVESHDPSEFENPDIEAPETPDTPDLPGSLGDDVDPVDPTGSSDPLSTPEPPAGMSQTDSGLYVPDSGLGDGATPLPDGFGTSDGGLIVPDHLLDGPSGLGDGPSGLGDLPSGLGDGPSGLGDLPSGLVDGPSGLGDGPSGLGDLPSGLGDGPSGLGDGPSGLGDGPSGLGDGPDGDVPPVGDGPDAGDIEAPDADAIDGVADSIDNGLDQDAPHAGDGADGADGSTGDGSDPDGSADADGPTGPEAVAPITDHPDYQDYHPEIASDGSDGATVTPNGYEIEPMSPETRAALERALAEHPDLVEVDPETGQVRTTEPITVDFSRNQQGHDFDEMVRQATQQVDSGSRLTVAEWLHNVDHRHGAGVRDAADAQRLAQRSQGMSGSAVLHGPDGFGGGRQDDLTDGIGDGRVNSALGRQWQGEIGDVLSQAQAIRDLFEQRGLGDLLRHVHMNFEVNVTDRAGNNPVFHYPTSLSGRQAALGPFDFGLDPAPAGTPDVAGAPDPTGAPDAAPADPAADASPERAPLPHESSDQFGDGWQREASPADANPIDPHYGDVRPDGESGRLADKYAHPGEIDPAIEHLIDSPNEEYGHDAEGNRLTREQWESRYTDAEGRPIYPGNAGGVEGSFIHYSDVDAFTRDYGSQVDRFGSGGGDYFGLPSDSFESRSLPPSNLSDPYTVLDVRHLPKGWSIEVSKIAPAFGRDGGGTQIRFLNADGKPVPMDRLTPKGRDANIDDALKIVKSVVKKGIKGERKIDSEVAE